jgi:hypothetical protein
VRDLLVLFVDNHCWFAKRRDTVLDHVKPRPNTNDLFIIVQGPLDLRSFEYQICIVLVSLQMGYASVKRQVVTTSVTNQTFYRVINSFVTSRKKISQRKCRRQRYKHFEDSFSIRIIKPLQIKKVHFRDKR